MNEWHNVKNLMDENMQDIDSSKISVSFNDYINAILADLHIDMRHKFDISTPTEFVKFMHSVFPLSAESIWIWVKKIIRLYYLSLNKNEYIACVKRYGDKKSLLFQERADIEFNEEYIQTVVSIIPMIKHNDQTIYVFIKESKSDMKGYTTMLGGHIAYKRFEKFRELVEYNVKKELQEELGISDLSYLEFDYDLKHYGFNTIEKSSPGDISYYHVSYSIPIEIPKTLIFESRLEPGKEFILWCKEKTDADIRDKFNHTMKIYNNLDDLNPDDWLIQFINKQ